MVVQRSCIKEHSFINRLYVHTYTFRIGYVDFYLLTDFSSNVNQTEECTARSYSTPCLKIKRNYTCLYIHWIKMQDAFFVESFTCLASVKFDLCVYLSPKESQKSYFAPRTCKICHILWQGGSEFQINATKVSIKGL